MQRIVTFRIEDICADAQAVAEAVTESCKQPSGRYRVRGICQVDDAVYIVFLPAENGEPKETYRFVEVNDETEAGITSLLAERWSAGFDAIGSVSTDDGLDFILFAYIEDAS